MSTMWMLWVALSYAGGDGSGQMRIDKEMFPSKAQCMVARQAIVEAAGVAGYRRVVAVCFAKSLVGDMGALSEEEQQPKLKFKEGKR